jgi:hypothetical protein
VKITIFYNIPSNNEVITMNHWKAKQTKQRITWALIAALQETGWRKPRGEFGIKMAITSFRGRLLDEDNLAGGCKLLIDAMKDTGLIFRDSPKWLHTEFFQHIDRLNPRTEIEISQVK